MGTAMSHALEQLGNAVGRAQDETLARDDDLHVVRHRLFVEGGLKRARQGGGRRTGIYAALAVAASLLLIIAWQWLSPLGFEVNGASSVAAQWVDVPNGGSARVAFSDGTTVQLEGGSRARVMQVTRHGARIELERGRALVSVVPGRGGHWQLAAGPFEVVVTGTRFEVAWDPGARRFSLQLHEGTVEVTGPNQTHQALTAGQSLHVDVDDRKEPAPPQPTASATVESAPDAVAEQPDAAEPPPSASAAASGPSWQQLAKNAQHDEAWAAVEAIGFDALCERASPGELMALADVARYAGKGANAVSVYTTVRRRFPGSNEAALSAYTLGRMAFHGGGGYRAAIRWLNIYLQEAPNGPLAREALGRIMEAHHNSGSKASARATAKQYLASYPKGPHAPLAKSILGK